MGEEYELRGSFCKSGRGEKDHASYSQTSPPSPHQVQDSALKDYLGESRPGEPMACQVYFQVKPEKKGRGNCE